MKISAKKRASIFISGLGALASIMGISAYFGYDFSDITNPNPLYVQIVGVKETRTESISKTYHIDKTNSDHDKNTEETTRHYKAEFPASHGFTIDSYQIEKKSNTRDDIYRQTILDDGKKLSISYSLRAGPKVDKYRGWLKADVITQQSRIIPQKKQALGNPFNAVQKGESDIISFDIENFDKIELRREDGFYQVLTPNELTQLNGTNRFVMLEELGDMKYRLISKRNWF